MDNLLEYLIPLIFAAIYFFGNMFSGNSKDEEDAPPTLPRSRGADDEPDAAERQRRIQEEIRRKIMERRRASEGGQVAPAAPAGHDSRERPPPVPVPRETHSEARERPSAYSIPSREREPEPGHPAFSWDKSDDAYENSMQAKLRRIEETKRKAEKLQKQAAERRDSPDKRGEPRKPRTGGYFTGTVRESLQDPQAARVAFIYGEVLGQPISLRKGSSSVPGLG